MIPPTDRQLFDDEMNPVAWVHMQTEWRTMKKPGEIWGAYTTIFAFYNSLVVSAGPTTRGAPQTEIVRRNGLT